jgi:ATP-dependent DNA ligase
LPIVHTERVFRGRPTDLKIPKKLVGTVLKGELYGVRRPKTVVEGTEPQEEVIPPQELGGLLNATLANSLKAQQEKGISLKNMVYDLQSLGSKSVDMDAVPYAQRLALVKEVIQHLPADVFHAPAEANSPEEATQLWRSIGEGKHPLTREGIVIHPPTGVPSKAKFLEDQDVHIRGMFPGEGKYYKRGVGGFTYSLTPDGPVLGRVGTGFDDDLRMDMYRNPDAYTGRVARVQHQGAFPGSGALRAPSFIALHEG